MSFRDVEVIFALDSNQIPHEDLSGTSPPGFYVRIGSKLAAVLTDQLFGTESLLRKPPVAYLLKNFQTFCGT